MEKVLSDAVKDKIHTDNKINCIELFNVSQNLNIHPQIIGSFVEKNGIRIKNCEAGGFDEQKVSEYDHKVYQILKKYTDDKNRIKCRDVWMLSEQYGFLNVTSVIRKSDIDVIYCLFGCFREKHGLRLKTKIDVWIENKATGIVLDKNIVAILRLIKEGGSIASAAKVMHISYKKAWSSIKLLENNMNKIYVVKSRGRGKGGSIVTDEAAVLIKKFEILQNEIEDYADKKFTEMFYKDRIKNIKE